MSGAIRPSRATRTGRVGPCCGGSSLLEPSPRGGDRAELFGSQFGESQVERPDGMRGDRGDRGAGDTLVVGRYHVPWRPLRAGRAQGVLVRLGVVVPVRPFGQVVWRELPVLGRVVQALE